MNYMIATGNFPDGIRMSWPTKTDGYKMSVCSETIQLVSSSNLKIYQTNGETRCNLQIPASEKAHLENVSVSKNIDFQTEFSFCNLAPQATPTSVATPDVFISPDGKRLVVHYQSSGHVYIYNHANSIEASCLKRQDHGNRLIDSPVCLFLPSYARAGRFLYHGIRSVATELYYYHVAENALEDGSDGKFTVQAIDYNTGQSRKVVEFSGGVMHLFACRFRQDGDTGEFFCVIRRGNTCLLGSDYVSCPVLLGRGPDVCTGLRCILGKVLLVHTKGVDIHDIRSLSLVGSSVFCFPGHAQACYQPPVVKDIIHVNASRMFFVETVDAAVYIYDIATGKCIPFEGIKLPFFIDKTIDNSKIVWTDDHGVHVAYMPLCVIHSIHKPDKTEVLCFIFRGKAGECVLCTRGRALANLMFDQPNKNKIQAAMNVYKFKSFRPCAGCSNCNRISPVK